MDGGVLSEHRSAERVAFRLAPIDWLAGIYAACAMSICLGQLMRWRSPGVLQWELQCILFGHALLLGLVTLAPLARMQSANARSVLAEWYPLFTVTALFAAIGILNAPAQHAGASFDATAQYWDARIFGAEVAFTWSRAVPSVGLAWVLGLCYLAFYPMLAAAPAVLWLKGKHGTSQRVIFGITLSLFLCYLVFMLFPVAGPTYSWGWPTNATANAWPVRMLRMINEQQDSWGSAFPSSHVAASMTAAILTMRGCKVSGTAFLLVALGIVAAIVFCGVHYGVDALAGLGVAAAASWAAVRLCPIDERA